MKKFTITLITLALICCNQVRVNNFGQGGKNAAQYILDQLSDEKEFIESIEVTAEDSLLTDRMLSFGQVQFAIAGADYWQDIINREQYQYIIDSTSQVLQDVQDSWHYSIAVKDSLKKLEKYKDNWAKVYTVKILLKNGYETKIRILMDQDGTTPRMTEDQFNMELKEYTDKISAAQRDIYRK
ncbi:MAG: hypothetical protein IJ887_06595 [Prevotella sp.]|nr:hypothetical protein [Prevotella sp.]MBR3479435.1 hypothetical protein [Prevotella sp.]